MHGFNRVPVGMQSLLTFSVPPCHVAGAPCSSVIPGLLSCVTFNDQLSTRLIYVDQCRVLHENLNFKRANSVPHG